MHYRNRFFAAAVGLFVLSTTAAATDGETQTAKLLPAVGTPNDSFGHSVAVGSTTVVVGAPFAGFNGSFSGAAYLFDVATNAERRRLLPRGGNANDLFGWSVALSGTLAVVGAYKADSGSGAAYVFGTARGVQLAKLVASDAFPGAEFGFAVAISGSTVLVGAKVAVGENGLRGGAAYLFDATTGVQTAKLIPTGGSATAWFGHAVAIDGNLAVVSALIDAGNSGGVSEGAAYVFDTRTGVQIARLVGDDGEFGDRFGSSVGIAGNIVLVGAMGDNDNGTDSGSAYLFDATSGARLGKLLPAHGAADNGFGISVAIGHQTGAVGSVRGISQGLDAGVVHLFDTATHSQVGRLRALDGWFFDRFARSVSLSGSTAVVGAPYDDDNGKKSGSAYRFATGRASALVENGSGSNASIFTNDAGPKLGGSWSTSLDCSGHLPDMATLVVRLRPSSGTFLRGGELLLDFTSPQILSASQPHVGSVVTYSFAVPNDAALCGLTASAQGVVFGGPAFEFSNALALTIGG